MERVWMAWLARFFALACVVGSIFAAVSLSRWTRVDSRLDAPGLEEPQRTFLSGERARAEASAIAGSLCALGSATGLAIVLLAAAGRARSNARQSEQERARASAELSRLIEAIECLNEGFVLFDADDRLLACNQRFREAYRDIADCLEPGRDYESIKRAGAERGLFPDAHGKVEEWLAENVTERQRFTQHEERLSGDRWVMVSNRPTRDGGFVGVRTDITELKRREMELRQARGDVERQAEKMRALAEEAQAARDLLRDAIESVNEGFCLFDENDRLTLCNSRWLDLHARVRDQIRPGAAFADILRAAIGAGQLVAGEDIEAEVASRVASRRSQERTAIEEQFADDRWISASTRRMRDGKIVSVLNDITTLKQREFALGSTRARLEKQAREMASLAEAAQRANRAKSEFLAMMSHEIRTPLNGVISALGLVADRGLPAGAASLVETARASAWSLLAILNDVLDMSKIEAGKLELEPAPFRLRDLVDGVAALCGAQAREKGLSFSARLAEDAPEWAMGDVGRIRQMALNYATNAVKFTESGRVEFEVSVAAAGGDWVRFEVVDSGIGIPLEQHGRVFRDFTQLDQSLSRRYGGTGLGLAITRRLARMMGGTIGFDSTPGVGSAFWFEIPLPAAAPADARGEGSDNAAAEELALIAARAPSILLVEDNDTNRLLARLALEKMGCRVEEALDGAQAVEAAGQGGHDAILMDISMPVMDGLEAARRIRAAGIKIPIVALTAHTGVEIEADCAAAGMDGQLTKPIDAVIMRRWLAGLDRQAPVSKPPAPSSANVGDGAALDPAPLQAMRAALDADGFARVIASCRKDIADESRALASALAAPGDEGAKDRARRAAHKLAGLASTIGAAGLAQLAGRLEVGAVDNADVLALAGMAEAALRGLDASVSMLASAQDAA